MVWVSELFFTKNPNLIEKKKKYKNIFFIFCVGEGGG